MRTVRVVGMVVGCLAGLARAQAQTPMYLQDETGVTGRIVWNIGGTLAWPLGPTMDRVNVGGGFTLGVTYNVNPAAGLQFEYGLDWSSLKTGKLANVGIHGDTLLQYFNLNAVFRPLHGGQSGIYLVGGGGLYYRGVTVSRVDGTAIATYCDPWLYYCSPVPVTTSSIIGSRSSWDWGLDAGLGFTFAVAPPVRLYFEARYHYIFGPSFTDASGVKRNADGQLLPFTVGLKF